MKGASTHAWLRRVSDYHSGGVSAAERVAVEAHLAGCAECRRALAAYRRFYALARSPLQLDGIDGERPAADADAFGRLIDGLDGERDDGPDDGPAGASPLALHASSRRQLIGTVAAALLLTLVGAALFRSYPGRRSRDTVVPGLGTLTQFALPAGGRHPRLVVAGPDGNVWFATDGALGRITPAGAVRQFPLPGGATAAGLATGRDGALWYTDLAGGRLGRLDPRTGAVTEFALTADVGLDGPIAAGPDGNLWFPVERGRPPASGNDNTFARTPAIGRITPGGVVTAFPLPIAVGAQLGGGSANGSGVLAAGPDGALWFITWDGAQNEIGRISTTGDVTLFPVPDLKARLAHLAAGPDGNLWVVETGSVAAIARVTPRGVVTAFALPAPLGTVAPGSLATGPDGNLWIAAGGRLGRVTPAGAIRAFTLPSGVALDDIVAGPDGKLWGSDTAGDRVVRIALARSG